MNQRAHTESVGKSGMEGTAGQHSLCSGSGQVRVAGEPDGERWQQRRPGKADLVPANLSG